MKTRAIPLLLAGAIAAAACSDNQMAPRGAATAGELANTLYSCAVAQDSVDAILPQIFTPGSQRGISASDAAKMNKALRSSDPTTALQYMNDLIDLATTSYYAVPSQITGAPSAASRARVQDLISGLLCLNGITAAGGGPVPVTLPADNTTSGAGLVTPGEGGLIRNGIRTAGTLFNPGDVTGNVWVTITPIASAGPLDTPLDQFGPFYEFNVAPVITFNNPVLTGVCTDLTPLSTEQEDRIRLAHNLDPSKPVAPGNIRFGNIEITAEQSTAPLSLNCDKNLASANFLEKVVNFLLPDALYAGTGTGGSGGKVTNYSPFGSVDPATLTYGSSDWIYSQPSTGVSTPPSSFTGLTDVTTPLGGVFSPAGPWTYGAAPFGDVRATVAPGASYADFCDGNPANEINYMTIPIGSVWQRALSAASGDLTYLFARRIFYAPSAGYIDLPIDNDIRVWLDGVEVTASLTLNGASPALVGGYLQREGCATKGQVVLPSVTAGVHVLAIQGKDRGVASYFDAEFKPVILE
jgi:hypothetical protein